MERDELAVVPCAWGPFYPISSNLQLTPPSLMCDPQVKLPTSVPSSKRRVLFRIFPRWSHVYTLHPTEPTPFHDRSFEPWPLSTLDPWQRCPWM